MLHCDFSRAGAGLASHVKNALRRLRCIIFPLLPLLAGCGFKVISAADADRYCFACQTAGYAQCRAKANEQGLLMTQGEAEKVLSVIEVKQAPIGKEGAAAPPKAGMLMHIDGYSKY